MQIHLKAILMISFDSIINVVSTSTCNVVYIYQVLINMIAQVCIQVLSLMWVRYSNDKYVLITLGNYSKFAISNLIQPWNDVLTILGVVLSIILCVPFVPNIIKYFFYYYYYLYYYYFLFFLNYYYYYYYYYHYYLLFLSFFFSNIFFFIIIVIIVITIIFQLEDDVLAKPGYFSVMKAYADEQKERDWILLEFSSLGFIGKFSE